MVVRQRRGWCFINCGSAEFGNSEAVNQRGRKQRSALPMVLRELSVSLYDGARP